MGGHYLLLQLLDELLLQRLLLLRRLYLLQQSVVLRLRLRRLLLRRFELLLQLFVIGRIRWRAVRGLRTLYRITYELVTISNFVMRIQATMINEQSCSVAQLDFTSEMTRVINAVLNPVGPPCSAIIYTPKPHPPCLPVESDPPAPRAP